MYTARIVVLTIALSAGGVAAYLARGTDTKQALPVEPVVQLQTVDVLVAKSDIGLGQSVTPDNLQWQTWPAATASNSFIRRSERPDCTCTVHNRRADSGAEAGQGQRFGLHGGDPAQRHARHFD
jgi:pilus assembly protein CpaB